MIPSSNRSTDTRRLAIGASVAALSLALGLLGTLGCGAAGGGKSASADSTLARDLALANADSAARPRLADTTGSGAAADMPKREAPTPERRASQHHATAHATPHAPPAQAQAPAATPAAAPAPPPPPPLVVPTGTSLSVVLSDTVTTATAHAGDPITATVASDVTDAAGAVVIPAGSRVHGSVTASSGPAHTPHLGVAFNSVDVRGQSYPVQSNITVLPIVQSRRTARAAQVGEVAGGAAVGGLLGRAIGGKKSGGTLIGALAGAAAGVAVADKTESHDAVLPRGARVTLQLTSPISVPQ